MTSPILTSRARLVAALSVMALSLGLAACRKDDADKDKKADTKTARASADDEAPARSKAPAQEEGIDVPTEEDFEEAVAEQITPESDLQKELDQLEKEIAP